MVLAGLPQTGQTSEIVSCSKGMHRLLSPACSFMASSQASSPHHMVLIKPLPAADWALTSSMVRAAVVRASRFCSAFS